MSGRVSGPRKRLPRNWDNRTGILSPACHFTQAIRAGWFDIGPSGSGAPDLVRQARLAEEAGFDGLWISDHFHPWLDEQGQSPFVWSMIGAVSQVTSLPITTAVTCPLIRQHPAIVAQATATSALPNEEIPGEAAQLLALPRHFGELAQLVPEDAMSAPAGPDPAVHLAGIRADIEAGFDEVYIGQVGGEHEGFFEFYANTVLPRLRDS